MNNIIEVKNILLKECLATESLSEVSSSLQNIGIQLSLANIKLDVINNKIESEISNLTETINGFNRNFQLENYTKILKALESF